MKIAVPITAINLDQIRRDIDSAEKEGADLIELRVDYLSHEEELRERTIERLLDFPSIPIIFTNRHKDEAGPDPRAGFPGTESQRKYLLDFAFSKGVDYADIEASYPLEIKNRKNTRIIYSAHDFMKTPRNLEGLYRKIRKNISGFREGEGGDLIKIATMAKSREDAIRMLDLTRVAQSFIGVCMGEYGKPTRAIGPYFGSYLAYASLEAGKESAPNQLRIRDLRELSSRLGID